MLVEHDIGFQGRLEGAFEYPVIVNDKGMFRHLNFIPGLRDHNMSVRMTVGPEPQILSFRMMSKTWTRTPKARRLNPAHEMRSAKQVGRISNKAKAFSWL